jgi:Flp pilus assembly protein TadG
MSGQKGTFRKDESGQGLVELAISIVVLLILLAGIVEISRGILTKTAMQDAAEEGVLYASFAPQSCTEIQNRILDNLSKVKGVSASSITITYGATNKTCAAGTVVAGDLIKIKIGTSYGVSTPFIGGFIGNLISVNVEAKGIVIKTN